MTAVAQTTHQRHQHHHQAVKTQKTTFHTQITRKNSKEKTKTTSQADRETDKQPYQTITKD
jgi:hypothetical protein